MRIEQILFHSPRLKTSLLVPLRMILPLYKPHSPLGLILIAASVVLFLDNDFLFLETVFGADTFFVAMAVLFLLFYKLWCKDTIYFLFLQIVGGWADDAECRMHNA